MGFVKFLRSRDFLGHPHTINFKGEPTFTTKLGATFSIAIQIFVLIYLAEKCVSFIQMSDPSILQYSRPIYQEEDQEFGAINLDEYRFNFGLVFLEDFTDEAVALPEGLGRVQTKNYTTITLDKNEDGNAVVSSTVNCTDLFQWKNMRVTNATRKALDSGYCLDPQIGSIEGVSTYRSQ